ncbi:hypothetical protein [Kitasatospora sp. NPDC086791]|uniref:hypothetical protein n=1 Tax=Kitasatospora sp. NPDC086791 TaxID=3155178 RepID=UPI003449A5D0
MNYGRIRRGPMAADAFTQIRNALFRDTHLSFRDKGVFGLISTHRDGFGVSAESIAAMSPTDGLTAVKTSLRNLEKRGYLQRTRQRNANGTLGGAVYYITDQPEAFEEAQELESASSEPAVAQPPLAQPTLGGPTLAEPAVVSPTLAELPHKNTNSKHTSRKKTTSPSRPCAQPAPAPVARPVEREEEAGRSPELNRAVLFLQRLPAPWTIGPKDAQRIAPALLGTAARLGWSLDDDLADQLCTNPDGINSYAAVLERDRIPNLIPHQAVHGRRGNLPPVCGSCLDDNPHAAHNPRWRTRNGQACPDCHPAARAA